MSSTIDQGLRDIEIAKELGRDALLEAFQYLDELRASGRTNMWCSHAFLARDLCWPQQEASDATGVWMHTFKAGQSVAERVDEILTR